MPAGSTIPSSILARAEACSPLWAFIQSRHVCHQKAREVAGKSRCHGTARAEGSVGEKTSPSILMGLSFSICPRWLPTSQGCHYIHSIRWGQLLPGLRHSPAAMAATLASQEAWLSAKGQHRWVEFGSAQNEGLEAELCSKDSSPCSHPKALRTGK